MNPSDRKAPTYGNVNPADQYTNGEVKEAAQFDNQVVKKNIAPPKIKVDDIAKQALDRLNFLKPLYNEKEKALAELNDEMSEINFIINSLQIHENQKTNRLERY